MRRSISLALLPALLLAGSTRLPAQPADDPPTAEQRYQQIVNRFEADRAQYGAAIEALMESDAYRKARAADDSETLTALWANGPKRPDVASYADEMLTLADEYQGKADAVRFLVWVAQMSRDAEQVTAAFAILQRNHLQSAELIGAIRYATSKSRSIGRDKAAAFLDAVIQTNEHDLVRAHALLARAQMLKNGSEEEQARVEPMLTEALELAGSDELTQRIQASRFEHERLQIGMVAPDIEGEDLDGFAFKLSDYRGKVVVLSFWGDW